MLSLKALNNISSYDLAQHIKPAGFFNLKSKRLKNFINFIFSEYKGSLQRMQGERLNVLRKKILTVNGIGPETADSILLYAFGKSSFVVDAYTKRVLSRHSIIDKDLDYHDVQDLFLKNLKKDNRMFNEYHALIVKLGKEYCKTKPLCGECPLKGL